MTKQIRGIVKELDTVVKPIKDENGGRVNLPASMRDKRILIDCLDGTGFLYTYARKVGNSAYARVAGDWIGKRVNVKVLEEKVKPLS